MEGFGNHTGMASMSGSGAMLICMYRVSDGNTTRCMSQNRTYYSSSEFNPLHTWLTVLTALPQETDPLCPPSTVKIVLELVHTHIYLVWKIGTSRLQRKT